VPTYTAIAGLFIAFLFSCSNNVKEVQMVNADKESPDESMSGVTIFYSDNGKHRAELKTPLIYKFGTVSPRTEFPKGLVVEFFTIEGEKESLVKSNYAIMDDKTRQLVLEKNVVMINFMRQDTLNTEYLVWKQDSAVITTDRKVHIHGIKGSLNGDHFRSKENFTKYAMKNITSTYFYNESDSL
jgi:LPS export ABC transporter protein LptC